MDGMALGAIAIGAIFLYSGIKGKGVLSSIQSIVQGKAPSTTPNTNQIVNVSGAADAASNPNPTGQLPGASISDLPAIATQDVGHAYLYGGAPGISGQNPWDCSSACNWWYGHRAGFAIPGEAPGAYTGAVHGPATGSWLLFGNAVEGGLNAAEPGDVLVWETHMGVYLGGGNMISALDPKDGTKITTVEDGSPFGEVLLVRRLD